MKYRDLKNKLPIPDGYYRITDINAPLLSTDLVYTTFTTHLNIHTKNGTKELSEYWGFNGKNKETTIKKHWNEDANRVLVIRKIDSF